MNKREFKVNFTRCFIAAEIPKDVKAYLESVREKFAGIQGVNPVPKENLHITLAFLGEVNDDERSVAELTGKTSGVARGFGEFGCSLEKIEAHPRKIPRLIWISVNDGKIMEAIHSSLAAEFGLGNEKFSAHITLARIKNPAASRAVLRKLSETTIIPVNFKVRRLNIMKSRLAPSGSVYSIIKSINLNSDA